MGFGDPKNRNPRVPHDISEQVKAFRALLREKEYLTSPSTKVAHTSLSGKALDKELVDFCETAAMKRNKFCDLFIDHHQQPSSKRSVHFDEPPECVTPEERAAYEHISNKPLQKIHIELSVQLELISDIEMRTDFESEYLLMKKRGALKQEYVDFHNVLMEYIELQENTDTVLHDDDITCDE